MSKRIFGAILVMAASNSTYGQAAKPSQPEVASSDRRETGVVLGLNYSRYLFAEVGYFRSHVYEMGGFEMNSTTLAAGSEFSYVDRLIVAPKLQARVQLFLLQASLSPILYSDFTQASLKLRSEIGLGLYNGGITYGYNTGIVNNGFKGVNTHVFALRYYLTRTRKPLHEYDQKGKRVKKASK